MGVFSGSAATQFDSVAASMLACTRHAFARLRELEHQGADGRAILCSVLAGEVPGLPPERIAVVSSFGAESAVLLSMVAAADPSVPVIFLDTHKHFPETLAYRDELASRLGLTDVRDVHPHPDAVRQQDPDGELWYFDGDACCALRKVRPLDAALGPFAGWVSGRKRYQASTRTALPFVELERDRIKLNPLADWDGARVREELVRLRLPPHPLVERGYPSIGCSVCTRTVGTDEDARAGRWAGSGKVECGIHQTRVATS